MSTHLYEVTLDGNYLGQQIVNRWNYRSDGDDVPSGNAFGLVSAMGFTPVAGLFTADSLAKAITAFTGEEMIYQQVICRAVYVPTDFVDVPFIPGVQGEISGQQAETPFLAAGLRTNRVRTDIGRGYKRFAGLVEGSVEDGGVISEGALGLINTLAGLMSDVLSFTEDALTIAFTPCVVHKKLYHPSEGKNAYRYFTTEDGGEAGQLENIATGITWEAYTQVRSQTSRQYGKGR